ncbi:antitoxin family protein [Geminocystis herdmanii]|uniref:antitoxin family protein n=1 Tax=Geminocystis herdmanii TaxID=669359 RepID=UPI0003475C45|nr:antitoxin family protein [Geminocystis herdmanii]
MQKLLAIYENGLLRPLNNPNLPENTKVNIVIESNVTLPHSLSQFAGILSDQEAEEIENIINQEFNIVNNDEW